MKEHITRRQLLQATALVIASVIAVETQGRGGTDRTADAEVPRLIELLELKPGMTVADIGAGSGAWTLRFARWLGPSGRVYTTEIGSPQLAGLRDLVKREGLDTVTVVEGAASSTNLPPLCCDAILIRDAYHHLTQPDEMVRSMAASLKPGGRLAVIDFPPRANSRVPDGVAASRGGHGVPPEVVEREAGAALSHVRTIPTWSPDSQPSSLYLVLFRKPS
jgi:ubiquinone/menaquinone biosynthesis C-methylase UbiE